MIYLNGNILDQNDSVLDVRDRGFLHGDGLFETMRAYDGVIFALEDHIDRLLCSASTVLMDNVPSKDTLMDACSNTLEVNNLENAKVRLTVTKGLPGQSRATVLVTAEEYLAGIESKINEGLSAITMSGYRFSRDEYVRVKSISYQRSSIAKEKALRAGCEEAVLINERGNVCEGSFTNIFVVKGREIITPPISDGLLPGVTRAIVIRIAKENGFKVTERSLPVTSIYGMDEVFATNSLIEIVPVKIIDGRNIGDIQYSIIKSVSELYKNFINKAIGR